MKKIVSLGLLSLVATMTLHTSAHASAMCGDGNQRFTMLDKGETVFYAGQSEQFIVTRQAENKITVQDTIDCRFGKDVLIDISNVRFLDETIAVDELVIKSASQQMEKGYLALLLTNALNSIFGKTVQEEEQEVIPQNNTNTTSSFGFGNANTGSTFGTSNSNINSTNFGNVSLNSNGFNSAFPVGSFSGAGNVTVPQNNFQNQSNGFNTAGQFPTVNTNYNQNYSSYNANPFSTFGSQSTQQFTPTLAQAIVTWDTSRASANGIIYFDTINSQGKHFYLGAASNSAGSAQISIPAELYTESSIKVFIKSGTSVIGTYTINLQ